MLTEQELKLYLSQKLVEMGDALMLHYDPCKIDGDGCRAGPSNPCCKNTHFGRGVCPFWKNACTFPNPDCKLWICPVAARSVDPKYVEAAKLLLQVGELFGLTRMHIVDRFSGED